MAGGMEILLFQTMGYCVFAHCTYVACPCPRIVAAVILEIVVGTVTAGSGFLLEIFMLNSMDPLHCS